MTSGGASPGDSEYGFDKVVTMHVDGSVNDGAVVEINGENGDHVQCTPSGSAIDGVTTESTSSAGKVGVVVGGDVWTRDSTGLSAGDTVGDGDSDSNGTLNASAGSEYDVWHGQESKNGTNASLIYLD